MLLNLHFKLVFFLLLRLFFLQTNSFWFLTQTIVTKLIELNQTKCSSGQIYLGARSVNDCIELINLMVSQAGGLSIFSFASVCLHNSF